MTLKELLSVTPGYVTLCIHSKTQTWPAASAKHTRVPLLGSKVLKSIPTSPYTLEIEIEEEDI